MDYTDGTVFFFFNPFGADILRAVLSRIQTTLGSPPRPVRFLYLNPVHSAVFRSLGWLKYAGNKRTIFSSQQMERWVLND